MIFPDLGLDFKNTFQNDLPELPREPPGTLPGRPRWSQEALRALQDDSKSRQEGRKSRPHAVSEWPGRPPGANLAPKSPRRPSGRHFGPLGAPFWPLRGLILEGAPGPLRGRTKLTSGRPSGIILPDTPLNTWPGGMREAIK